MKRKRGKEEGGGREQKDWLLVVEPSPNRYGYKTPHHYLKAWQHHGRRGGKTVKARGSGSLLCGCVS